jgi:signal peptidase II
MTEKKQTKNATYVIAALFVIIGVSLDQWSKYLAVSRLKDQSPFILIDRVFQLCYLENRGAAFGIFQNRISIFLVFTVVILLAGIWIYCKLPAERKYLPLRFCIVCIIAGALGNMIDRIRLGYVVDFFYFNLIDFPIFNVADIYVTVATFLLIIFTFFYYKEEDFEAIFHR